MMQCPRRTPINLLSALLWNLCRLRRRPSVVDRVHEPRSIILNGIATLANSSENRTMVPSFSNSFALQFPGTHIMQMLRYFTSSFRHLRHSSTVSEFSTTESIAMPAIGTCIFRIATTVVRSSESSTWKLLECNDLRDLNQFFVFLSIPVQLIFLLTFDNWNNRNLHTL